MPDKSAKLEPDINTRAVNDESQEPEYGTWHEDDAATVLAEEKARLPKKGAERNLARLNSRQAGTISRRGL